MLSRAISGLLYDVAAEAQRNRPEVAKSHPGREAASSSCRVRACAICQDLRRRGPVRTMRGHGWNHSGHSSQICAATRRSWVMEQQRDAEPGYGLSVEQFQHLRLHTRHRARNRFVRTSKSGSSASARAMAMRWRGPPENWCGSRETHRQEMTSSSR